MTIGAAAPAPDDGLCDTCGQPDRFKSERFNSERMIAAQAEQIARLTRERDEALDEVDWLEKGNGEYQHLLRQAEKNLAQANLERDGYASRAERAEAECERLRALLAEAAEREQRYVLPLYRDENYAARIRAALAAARGGEKP